MENLKLVQNPKQGDVIALMGDYGRLARQTAHVLAQASAKAKTMALNLAAAAIRARAGEILAANEQDMAQAKAHGTASAFLDRLYLDAARIDAIARGLDEIATLPDPVGRVLAVYERPKRARHRARRDTARRHRHYLREPPGG